MGETIVDQQYSNILLASLPLCYNMGVCAITTNTDESSKNIDPAKVVKHISDNYNKCMLSKNKSDDQAFTTLTQSKKKDKCNLECYNCKRTGHIKANCWAKGGGKEGQHPECKKKRNDKDKSKDSTVTATDTGDDIESWALLIADLEKEPYKEDGESWSFIKEEYLANENLFEELSKDLFEALSEDSQDQVASTSGNTKAELYDSGTLRHITPS
jgi:hypothetical protein